KVTPLFTSMLVQPTEDEGAPSERPSEAQPTPSPIHTSKVPLVPQTDPSPTHTSEVPVEPHTDPSPTHTSETDPSPRPSPSTTIPESSGGNLGDEAKEIQHLKAHIKKLKKQAKPVVKHHRAWMKSVSLKQRLASKRSSKKQRVHRESVSKQGRKFAKGEPSVHKDLLFDEIPEEGSATQTTQPPTYIIFRDDETIAHVLLNMSQAKSISREKEKGVEFKDIEETDRPKPTLTRSLLTLKPLPKINPKDKRKKKIEEEDESESESDGIPRAEKKFKQLASDEEMARKIQE
ncbi:hypothetical protein Tco_1565601, partial [Tanacetum coccineum]